MRRVVVSLSLLAMMAVIALCGGCGPIISTYLIISAQADLDGAKAAEAEKYAVYEYTAASEFLHKAREEQGFADFGPAIDYAYKAQDLAAKATARAEDEKRKAMESGNAEWQAPTETTSEQRPSVIIKKKDAPPGDDVKVKVVPIPNEQGPRPK